MQLCELPRYADILRYLMCLIHDSQDKPDGVDLSSYEIHAINFMEEYKEEIILKLKGVVDDPYCEIQEIFENNHGYTTFCSTYFKLT